MMMILLMFLLLLFVDDIGDIVYGAAAIVDGNSVAVVC